MPFKAGSGKFVRIENIVLDFQHSDKELFEKIVLILGVGSDEILDWSVSRRGIDSRRKRQFIRFVYSVDVRLDDADEYVKSAVFFSKNIQTNVKKHRIRVMEYGVYEISGQKNSENLKGKSDKCVYEIMEENESALSSRPVVVGFGPAGLFAGLILAKAGLKPLIVERGSVVEKRIADIENFEKNGRLNVESNIQFGEGGAGTFSDGKLNALVNDERMRFVFDEFVEAGAPEEILWSGTPHIGTDKLREIVKKLRKKIISLGGEVLFDTCVTDLNIENDVIKSVVIKSNDGDKVIKTNNVILAIGHSARDTYEMLHENGVSINQKTFSVGVRIEHKRKLIDSLRFADFAGHPRLGTANYHLVAHPEGLRSVYSFCMCPGGYVVPSASEIGTVVTNGMSEFAQDGDNSNSALLVNVFPTDLKSDHPLAGVYFQRDIEKKAFELAGSDYSAPSQKLCEFLNNECERSEDSTVTDEVISSYKPVVKSVEIEKCLPDFVVESLRAAMPLFDRKLKGFASNDAVLTAPETRSSAPVQFVRDENFESNIKGLYPTGEGAGYAGGIVSAAMDGVRVAESIIKNNI